jgi:hypothetical protein
LVMFSTEIRHLYNIITIFSASKCSVFISIVVFFYVSQ